MAESAGYEVELKFPLGDEPADIVAALERIGAEFTGEIPQADHYFNHPVRDFARTDEAFRMRCVDDRNCITWKGPKLDAETKTRREIEIPLGDGAVVSDQFAEVLQILGFRSVACVRKQRRTYRLVRDGHEFEVALDEVAEVGSYLEIELLADEGSLKEAQSAVLALAGELDLSESEPRSYLALLLAGRES